MLYPIYIYNPSNDIIIFEDVGLELPGLDLYEIVNEDQLESLCYPGSSVHTAYTNSSIYFVLDDQDPLNSIIDLNDVLVSVPTSGDTPSDTNPLITKDTFDLHSTNINNPHGTTKEQLGLGNVDNTSDLNKPVSTAQSQAITTAQGLAEAYADGLIESLKGASPETLDTIYEIASALQNNPDVITNIFTALANRVRVDINNQGLSSTEKTNAKTNIDLQNVDNTSDVNKPISNATQTALDGKEPTFTKNTAFNKNYETSNPQDIGTSSAGTSDTIARGNHIHAHGNQAGGNLHALATQTSHGFMSLNDKVRFDNLKFDTSYDNVEKTTNTTDPLNQYIFNTYPAKTVLATGTYKVNVSARYTMSAVNRDFTLALYKDGVIIEKTRMTTRAHRSGDGYSQPYNMWATIDYVSNTTVLTLRGYVLGGSLTVFESEILLEKLP
mgnify:CR=1 FL=1